MAEMLIKSYRSMSDYLHDQCPSHGSAFANCPPGAKFVATSSRLPDHTPNLNLGYLKTRALQLAHFSRSQAPSREAIRFYESIPEMIFRNVGGVYRLSDDYLSAEPSIKTSLSFFAGMLAAYVIADEMHGLITDQGVGKSGRPVGIVLLHLADDRLGNAGPSKSNQRPDFCGLTPSGDRLYLFESKGTTKGRPETETLINAVNQLCAVTDIRFSKSVSNPQSGCLVHVTDRHAAVSVNYADTGGERACFIDIDPDDPDQQPGQLLINLDKALYLHYESLVACLEAYPHPRGDGGEDMERIQKAYRLARLEDGLVFGVKREIAETVTGTLDTLKKRGEKNVDKNDPSDGCARAILPHISCGAWLWERLFEGEKNLAPVPRASKGQKATLNETLLANGFIRLPDGIIVRNEPVSSTPVW